MDTRFQHPFCGVLAGPSSSGKTYFVERILKQIDTMINPIPEEVIFCYSAWQSSYERMKLYFKNIKFIEGIPDFDEIVPNCRRFIIIDDLMQETNEKVTNLFTRGSHHKNLSVFYICQNLFNKNKEQRSINLNSHYIIVFKNPRDSSQIIHLAKQMFPGQTRYMQEAYKMATSEPFGYLLVDLKQNTPENLRLRSNIFQKDQQIFYVPK